MDEQKRLKKLRVDRKMLKKTRNVLRFKTGKKLADVLNVLKNKPLKKVL